MFQVADNGKPVEAAPDNVSWISRIGTPRWQKRGKPSCVESAPRRTPARRSLIGRPLCAQANGDGQLGEISVTPFVISLSC
jgi:hypothetical protein